jgi:CRISPR/Cas system-associated exonuclease Cas4 (RecB family)
MNQAVTMWVLSVVEIEIGVISYAEQKHIVIVIVYSDIERSFFKVSQRVRDLYKLLMFG